MEFAVKLSKTTINILSGLYVIPSSSHFFRLCLRLLDHYWVAGENMCACTFFMFYFVLNCASSLSSFAAQTTPAASINKTFGLKIIEFFFQLQSHLCILATCTSAINPQNFATAKLSVL